MTFHDDNKYFLKAFIEKLGGTYYGTDQDSYEGPDHMIVFCYNSSSDWDEFIQNLKDHCNSILEQCTGTN